MIREQQRFRQSCAYHAYVVRLWQSNDAGCWRASAQCVQDGHTILFGDIEQLLAFLQRQVSHPPPLAPNAGTPARTGES